MATPAAADPPTGPLLTLGRVHRVRVQVGYRASPDGPAYQQFLLDLPVPEPGSDVGRGVLDESRLLAALEPALFAGAARPRHYSLHQHRWHTSWGASPGALEIGLLVTTGTRVAALSDAAQEGATRAFRGLLELAGGPSPSPISRDAAVQRAVQSAAAAYGLDPTTLSLSAEEHHPAQGSWTVGLRTTTGEEYDVVVGLVGGYAESVRVRHSAGTEVIDSVGAE